MGDLYIMKIVRLSNPMENKMITLAKIVSIIYARGHHVSRIFFDLPTFILNFHVKNGK